MNEFTNSKNNSYVSNTARCFYSIITSIKKSKKTKQYFTNHTNTIKHYFNFLRFRIIYVAIILKYIINVNNTPLIDHTFVTIIVNNNCNDLDGSIFRNDEYCLCLQDIFNINNKNYFNIVFENTTYFPMLFSYFIKFCKNYTGLFKNFYYGSRNVFHSSNTVVNKISLHKKVHCKIISKNTKKNRKITINTITFLSYSQRFIKKHTHTLDCITLFSAMLQ
mmetsp:Transcript_29501/g.51810  ORF Transcript_29501/g.51810 Transcript_29501/m.51810 type:complete len:220 (+) Transcript_29501:16-675(+)